MPIDFDADLDEIEARDGGTGLRKFAEAAQKDWRKTQTELVTLKAEKLIQDNDYHLVTADDLLGVPLGDLETKAEAVEAEKLESQKTLARDMLARKGLAGTELDRAVEDLLQPPQNTDQARERAAQASQAGGVPTPLVDAGQLHGVEAIRHGLSKK